MKYEYVASFSKRPRVTPDAADLAYRRTVPFLRNGTHYSIERLMQEAYLQGIRDAVEAMQERRADKGEGM